MSAGPDWSDKSNAELDQLRENARRVLDDPRRAAQHARAHALLESLPLPRPRAIARRGGAGDTATAAAVSRLTEVARAAREVFDLSPPAGTRHAHNLTAADGTPKVGGRQRAREVAADRYLSYKRGEEIVALGWLRRHEEDAATGGGWYFGNSALPTGELEEEAAVQAFLDALASIAPRRPG